MLALMFLIGILVSFSRLPRSVKLFVYAGIALRVIGALARMAMAADAKTYFQWGIMYAEYFARLDFSPLFDSQLWLMGEWGQTNFVTYPAGAIITFIGPSWFGTFLGFTLIAMAGVWAYAATFRRAFPSANYARYWAWLFLFPSLWFWPSSIGKEALMTLGLGVATLGLFYWRRRANWVVVALGLFVVFAIRPQVAAVYVLAIVLSYWLDFQDWSPRKLLQGAVIIVAGFAMIAFAIGSTRAGELGVESIQQYVEENAALADQGGSAVGGGGLSLASVPVALTNVLFRPFLWEAHNVAALFSALELTFMWGLLWFRRRQFKAMLKVWRKHRLLRFALAFVVIYVIALGMNLTNLGLLARQRTLVFPLFFLLFEAGSMISPQRSKRRAPRASARPIPA